MASNGVFIRLQATPAIAGAEVGVGVGTVVGVGSVTGMSVGVRPAAGMGVDVGLEGGTGSGAAVPQPVSRRSMASRTRIGGACLSIFVSL